MVITGFGDKPRGDHGHAGSAGAKFQRIKRRCADIRGKDAAAALHEVGHVQGLSA